MVVIVADESVQRQLAAANISSSITNDCLNSKFMIARYDGDQISGVCFVMGVFNVMGTEVAEKYRGRGLSHVLLADLVFECKRRNMPFLTSAFKPSNAASIKAHTKAGFVPVFTIHYNREEGKEISIILPINGAGRLAKRLSGVFDTRLGNAFFATLLWCSRPLIKTLLGFEAMPKIDLSYSVRNFEKVRDTINNHRLDTSS